MFDESYESQELFEYVDKYMAHHVSDRLLKDKVLGGPHPHNIKGTPVLDGYIKELLLENKKDLTVNHEDSLKSIQDRIGHVFDPLLQLWSIMKVEKEEALADLSARGQDISKLKQISSLIEQSVSFLCQVFNSTLYHRKKSILETLIDRKTKVREILKELSDSLNHIDNNYLFASHFELEFSKSVNAKKKSKSQFTRLTKVNHNSGDGSSRSLNHI